MTRKGLRIFLPSYSFGRHLHHHHQRPSSGGSPATQQQRLSEAMMEEHVAAAEAVIAKWGPETSSKLGFLFHVDRSEAYVFLAAVHDLQRAMLFFVSSEGAASPEESSSHATIVRAQNLMQTAMRRLEKEFHQILAANRDFLDLESSARSSRSGTSEDGEEDEASGVGVGDSYDGEAERATATLMADLHDIARAMFAAGYGKECIKVYKALRKSAVDEGFYRLGFERLSSSQINKLDWAVLDTKIRSWLQASRTAAATLLAGERILSDHVFEGSDSVREAVFTDIAGDAAVQFLRFPESVTKTKRATEKLVRLLDLYEAVARLLPEVTMVFSFDSAAAVREQALVSLSKLAEAARATIADFEAAVHKEHSKAQVPGGGIHPLTRRAMDSIATLADYEHVLAEIFADSPFQPPTPGGSFSDASSYTGLPMPSTASSTSLSYSSSMSSASDDGHLTEVAARLGWLILVLICKLDAKAAAYRDAGLSYLFLANNLRYIFSRVRSTRLRGILGEEWAARHAAKARHYAETYERLAWGKVAAAIPAGEVSPGEARERMLSFAAGLDEACAAQAGWAVADAAMREEVTAAVLGMLLPAYRSFYMRWRAAARLTPADVERRLAKLFSG